MCLVQALKVNCLGFGCVGFCLFSFVCLFVCCGRRGLILQHCGEQRVNAVLSFSQHAASLLYTYSTLNLLLAAACAHYGGRAY